MSPIPSSVLADQAIEDDDDFNMADHSSHGEPSAPGEATDFKVKLEDTSPFISPSPSYQAFPSSEPKDVHVQQETPDPPVLDFNIEIRQESLPPPRLHFNGSRSPSLSVHIQEESVTLPPPFFDCPARNKKALLDLENGDSEDEMVPNTGDSSESQQLLRKMSRVQRPGKKNSMKL